MVPIFLSSFNSFKSLMSVNLFNIGFSHEYNLMFLMDVRMSFVKLVLSSLNFIILFWQLANQVNKTVEKGSTTKKPNNPAQVALPRSLYKETKQKVNFKGELTLSLIHI